MRTTWNRALIAGALAASGLPGLLCASASAQGIAGGMTAPAAGGTSYSSPNTTTAASPYVPVISPYTSGVVPSGGSSPAAGVAGGGSMAQGAASYYGARANAGAARPPYGAAEYAPSGPRSAPATPPSPFLPGQSSPYGSAASPYASGAAGMGGRPVASSSVTNYSQGAPTTGRGVVPGQSGVELAPHGSSDPAGTRASYANPGAAAPADRSAPAAGGSAFAPDTMPYGPPPQPSRLRRFYNWLTGDDKSVDRPIHTYIDPSTGRTDLPLSKPWLKKMW